MEEAQAIFRKKATLHVWLAASFAVIDLRAEEEER